MNPPRVVVLANRFPEISETFVLDQFRALLRNGFDAHIVADPPRKGNAPAGWEADAELVSRVHWYPQPSAVKGLRFISTLGHAIQQGQADLGVRILFAGGAGRPRTTALLEALPFAKIQTPDLIHAQFGPNGLRALRLQKLGVLPTNAPLVVTFHGYDVNRSPLRYGKDMYQELFDKVAAFTCGSSFMADALTGMGAPAEKLHVIPMGIDTGLFRPEGEAGVGDAHELRIVTVSRLAVEKGLTYAVEALALLKQRGVLASWTLVGEGPMRRELAELAEKFGVSDQLEFAGARPHREIPAILQQQDVLVLPSIHSPDGNIEGQGLVLAEAQACGLPVVASRIGGIPESLVDGRTGILVPEKDPQALAGALAVLATDGTKRQQMSREARQWTVENFDQARLSAKFAHLLRSLL